MKILCHRHLSDGPQPARIRQRERRKRRRRKEVASEGVRVQTDGLWLSVAAAAAPDGLGRKEGSKAKEASPMARRLHTREAAGGRGRAAAKCRRRKCRCCWREEKGEGRQKCGASSAARRRSDGGLVASFRATVISCQRTDGRTDGWMDELSFCRTMRCETAAAD